VPDPHQRHDNEEAPSEDQRDAYLGVVGCPVENYYGIPAGLSSVGDDDQPRHSHQDSKHQPCSGDAFQHGMECRKERRTPTAVPLTLPPEQPSDDGS
jgi:hypothetical protein